MATQRPRDERAPRPDSKVTVNEARHMLRFLRAERGEKPEEIARQEGITLAQVQRSINKVQIQKAIFTSDNAQETLRRIVINNAPMAEKALSRALEAKKHIEKRKVTPDGKVHVTLLKVEDTDRQLQALREYKELASVTKPSSGGTKISVNQTNQTALVSNIKTEGYEERMTAIRQRAAEFNKLPPQVIASVSEDDKEIIDAEDDDEEEDE